MFSMPQFSHLHNETLLEAVHWVTSGSFIPVGLRTTEESSFQLPFQLQVISNQQITTNRNDISGADVNPRHTAFSFH